MELKGSQTEKNLLTAFAGESQARNRYTYFASQAKKDGFVLIQRVFEDTADQERVHAKQMFKLLEGGEAEVQAAFPAGRIGTTAENLAAAADGEHEEWSDMYPRFAQVARSEGLDRAARLFEATAVAEKQHEERYRKLLAHVENGTFFKRDQPVVWRCMKCGYVHEGVEAPKGCVACAHPQSWFEVLGEHY